MGKDLDDIRIEDYKLLESLAGDRIARKYASKDNYSYKNAVFAIVRYSILNYAKVNPLKFLVIAIIVIAIVCILIFG